MHATRILALCLTAACYSTPQPDCGFVCGPAGECPADYQCGSDQRCHRNGTPASLVCAVDAPPMVRDVSPDVGSDGDVTAPMVASTTPVNNATSVSRTTTITVTFDEAVFNVDTASVTVVADALPVTGMITAQSSQTYVFTPSNMLMPNVPVTVSLSSAISDFTGNTLVPTSFSFQTGT